MTKKQGLSFFHPARLLATECGIGNIPFAPGTWGSLPAFLVAYLIFINFQGLGFFILPAVIVALTILGWWATKIYMNATGKHDPKEVVVDELVGQLIVLLGAAPAIGAQDHSGMSGYIMLISCFVLFRFFDIIKPWPIGWCDKHVKGAWGVMLDDILAGIFGVIFFYAGWLIYQDFV